MIKMKELGVATLADNPSLTEASNPKKEVWRGLVSHTGGDQATYVPKWVQVVVGEFEFLEGDKLSHPMCSSCWGVWVHIKAARHGRLSFASYRPKLRR